MMDKYNIKDVPTDAFDIDNIKNSLINFQSYLNGHPDAYNSTNE
jgi:hypothetical protein